MKFSKIIMPMLTTLMLSCSTLTRAESAGKVLEGWMASSGTMALEENGKAVLSVPQGQGGISRYLSGKNRFLQFRVERGSRFYITGKNFNLPPIQAKPGVYTIPATGTEQKTNSFMLRFFAKEFVFCDYLNSAKPEANCVTVEKNGEEIVISMPVKEKPDSLSLTLYVIDSGKDWKYKGSWRQLDWPGVPARLTPEEDGIYRARFKLPNLPQDFSAPALTLVAAVTMAGGDNLSLGNFYGFFPFEIKIQASKQQTQDAHLKIYDLGPANTAPQAGTLRGDKDLIWEGLSGFKGSRGRVPWLDSMLTSWAEILAGKTARATLKVPKGKYHVSVGLGSITLPSYATHNHTPASGRVKINGKEIFHRDSAAQNRDLLMCREANEDDNFYRVYFKDLLFFDIDAEAEATERGIQLEFIADPQKIMVLNYIVIYPSDDQEAAERLARIRTSREERYNQFLTLTPIKQKAFAMKTPFAVFARENPDDNVCPDTLPSETEQKSPLALFGASDEMLSGTFFVRTGAKKINGLTVKLNGLPGELHRIMYIHHSTPSERKSWIGASHTLPAMEPVDLKPLYSYGWRIRMKGLAPGKYSGEIEVAAEGHTEKLPVEVTIHPLKLPELNDHLIAMDGDGIWGPYAADLMRFARDELGCTTAHLRMAWPTASQFELDQNGMPVKAIKVGGFDAERYDAWLDAFIKADFPVKTPWIGLMSIASRKEPFNQGPFKPFTKEYCQAVKLSYEFLRDHAQKKGLPGVIVDFGGEMGVGLYVPPERTIASAIKLYDLVNGMPGVQTSYRCNCYATVERFNPHLDIQGVRGKLSWKSADQITDYGRKKHIYSYSVGGRFLNGYHSWAHGARGNLREYMCYDHAFYRYKPNMAGASTTHDESVMSGNNRPLITVNSESFRGSVVDRQYLRLLDDAIRQAPRSAARTKAEAFRDMLRDTCLKYNFTDHNTSGSSPWECMRLDLMRQSIVECVLNLQKNQAEAIPDFRKVPHTTQVLKTELPKIDTALVPEEASPEYKDHLWPKINTGSWESQGYNYDGCAWYRKTFELKDFNQARIVFEGVDEVAWVWLNGKFLGQHEGWDKPFSFPLDQIAVKGKNTLCVLVFDSSFQGGIWRPVKVVNGNTEQILNQWKFMLNPGKQNLNVFELKEGPLVSAGTTKLKLSLLIYGFPNLKVNSDLEIRLDGTRLPVEVLPYHRIEQEISVLPVGKGAHRLELQSGGKIAASYDFYGI